jgi:hypothetical protein
MPVTLITRHSITVSSLYQSLAVNMSNAITRFYQASLPHLTSSLTALGLTLVATTGTIVAPTVSFSNQLPQNSASAQDDDTFDRYVKAAYEIRKEQDRVMGRVKELTEGNAPRDVCRNINQVNEGARGQVAEICGNFQKFLGRTLKKHGLSSAQYNQFHVKRAHPEMMERINQRLQDWGLR